MELLVKLLVAGGVMGVLDFLWLGFVAKKLYYDEMGKLLLEKPNMGAALIFYAVYVVGVVLFVVTPALEKGSLGYAALYGALFGFVAYATYDLTNLAVLKGYSTKIAIIDMAWGAALTATVATVTVFVIQRFFS